MEHPTTESGSELVLDNRKLIGAFLILMILCGGFFVIGFMEGKRQGLQSTLDALPANHSESIAEAAEARNIQPATKDEPINDRLLREQLDWYKNVNQKAEPEAKIAGPEDDVPAAALSPPSGATKRPARSASTTTADETAQAAATVTYSVQVGAFRQRRQAEVLRDQLQAKGYSCETEDPETENGLYLVMVGRFDSRADAVAMQLRLKRDGYGSFIKSK